jgi:rhodanese-related sulfurtransferase
MFGTSIKEIQPSELTRWHEEKKGAFRVIDVRQPHEVAAGTVPGAQHIPLHTLPLRISELGRDETLVMVCHTGGRSAQACMFLQQQGYANVHNLRGGMVGWASSGQPIGQAV